MLTYEQASQRLTELIIGLSENPEIVLQRGASVIPKSTNAKRLQENFESTNIVLKKDEMSAIAF